MRSAIFKNIFGALIFSVVWLGSCHAESARPAGLSEVDWSGLKAAMLTIAGPYQQEAELGPPGPGTGFNYFGNAVAAWFDTASGKRWAVVGAYGDDGSGGAAYVFRLDPGASQWHQEARLIDASNGKPGDSFGKSVAISGNTVAVGAPSHTNGSSVGAVYIFVRDAMGQWTQQGPTLYAAGNSAFGYSVALQGDTLAVGAPNLGSGYVFMYQRVGTSWNANATPFPPDMPTSAGFGWSVAIDSNRLLVGAPYDSALATFRGSAYVFTYDSAAAKWNFQQKLDAYLAGAAYDYFGWSVALAGDAAVIGVPGRSNYIGAVHSFNYDSGLGLWKYNPMLLPADGAPNDDFGWSVALSGGWLAVGSINHSGSGSAYLYTGSPAAWTSVAMLSAKSGKAGDESGYSIAFAGKALLSGAWHAVAVDFPDRGRVDVFQSTGTAWVEQPAITASDEDNFFGQSVAVSGDTAVVSAANQANGVGTRGVANIFVRDATGLWQWQASLPHPQIARDYGAFFGCSPVAIDGDTVLVGVPDESFGSNAAQGAVYVYGRSGTTWSMRGTLLDLSGHALDHFGCSIALSGNTAVIGAVGLNGSKGGAYVFARSGSSWTQQRILTASDAAPGDKLGLSAALSGDTILLGAPFNGSRQGAAYVFGPSSTTQIKKLVASDGAAGDQFGASVALSGVHALIGAPGKFSGSTSQAGGAYLYTGSGASWTEQKKFSPPSPNTNGFFGDAVALAGTTAAIGEWGQHVVHIFTRRGTSWSARSDAATDTKSGFGVAVALSGSTVIIGAPFDSGGGRAYIASDADLIFADDFE